MNLRIKAGWVLSNIFACNKDILEYVFNYQDLLQRIMNSLIMDVPEVKAELL